ncbi:MAG: MerR family transcriptional regulator [Xanthomonadales bacterium]|nr:MerR family transcriptional regulator [Xanthomonadales bacterium]
MSKTTEQYAQGMYPIRTVSDLTGVNPVTLRAWERRYGLIEPHRSDSGHRLYSEEHISLINRIVGLLDRGMRIGQVKPHLEARESRQAAPGAVPSAWDLLIERMVAGAIRFDEEELERAYSEALANHPVNVVTSALIVPLLEELGERWARGEGTVAEEHFLSCYVRNKLGARFHHRVRSSHGPKLLLACLPEDRHEIGLLLFALAANEAGFRVVLLGADMPLEDIPEAAEKIECDAIVLSALMPPSDQVLGRTLPEMVSESSVPVLVGGKVSVLAHEEIKSAGAVPLGTDMNKSISTMRQALLH